ncbi:MAG: hypothetical protein ABIS03_11930, partial [Gemmatimonadaceae bacterium]
RMPAGGGTPRELLTSVSDGDWSPDGNQLAVIHEVNGRNRLEYPIGTVLYETRGYLSDVRVSPDGQHLAFTEHPDQGDNRGAVAVVDLKGSHRILTPVYLAVEGLAWVAGGTRLAYSASTGGGLLTVNEVTLSGEVHLGPPGVGNATIHDVARDGRRLIVREDYFKRIWMKRAGDNSARDLSWLDVSFYPVLSADGSQLAYSDGSSLAGDKYSVMLRRTDGSAAVRLGEGSVLAMSRDKQWVMSVLPSEPAQLMLYPTGAGSSRRLDDGKFGAISDAAFLGGGSEIVVCGSLSGKGTRCYTRQVAGGAFRPFTPEGVQRGIIASPDGQSVVARISGVYRQFSIRDGTSQSVPGLTPTDQVIRYNPDGKSLWTRQRNSQPVRVEQVDLGTGRRSMLLPEFSMSRPGLLAAGEVSIADDFRNYTWMERESASYMFELRAIR